VAARKEGVISKFGSFFAVLLSAGSFQAYFLARLSRRAFSIPVRVNSGLAEVHSLEDETETRAYIDQAWAEAMEMYRSGDYKLTFPKELQGLL